ncbi:MAG: ABC transporter ATP-binding protein [Butyrivibrio sp.]
MPYIDINNIKKKYGRKEVLKGITFEASQGDCVGIVGINGCGKSTLLKILAGAMSPDCGSILYDGKSPLGHKKFFSDCTGYIPQENPLFDNLTVLDNLKLWYCDSPHNLKEDIDSGIIARFGLDRYLRYTVRHLSGGMKKRLSIVCGVSKDPGILILDEPGASLDIVCKEEIINYIKEYISRGNTAIIASHEERELSVCNKMYIMENGILTFSDESMSIDAIFGKLVQSHG